MAGASMDPSPRQWFVLATPDPAAAVPAGPGSQRGGNGYDAQSM
jgi:hypothetical protein